MKKTTTLSPHLAAWGIVLFTTLFGINATKSLKVCSLCFVTSMYIVHNLTLHTTHTQAIAISFSASLLNALIFFQIHWLWISSFCGLVASTLANVSVTRFFQKKIHPLFVCMAAVGLAILVDATIMFAWEYHTFAPHKALRILCKALCYKSATLAVYLSLSFLANKIDRPTWIQKTFSTHLP